MNQFDSNLPFTTNCEGSEKRKQSKNEGHNASFLLTNCNNMTDVLIISFIIYYFFANGESGVQISFSLLQYSLTGKGMTNLGSTANKLV